MFINCISCQFHSFPITIYDLASGRSPRFETIQGFRSTSKGTAQTCSRGAEAKLVFNPPYAIICELATEQTSTLKPEGKDMR